MTQIVLVGLGAGAAAALLFASVISGALVSILLFYLAPLPILIAALGWSHWCGLLAAVTASACLGLAFGMLFFAAFLVGIAAPAWWLGYLALLARPGTAGSGADLEWYPPGRLVLWAAGLGAVVVTIALFQVGTDEESIRNGLKVALERIFRQQTGTAAGEPLNLPGIAEPDRLLDLFAVVMPPVAATASVLTLTLNLWIAARVVNLSGRLKRPWPDIPAMTFPRYAPALLAAAAIASFMPDARRRDRKPVRGDIAGRLHDARLRRAARADARLSRPQRHAERSLCLRRRARVAGAGGGAARPRGVHFPLAGPDAATRAAGRAAKLKAQSPIDHFANRQPMENVSWKSFCSNGSPSSARWAKSSASRTGSPAISCCPRARRCARPRTTASNSSR